MLNIIYHAAQQLVKVLSSRMAEGKLLHKVPMVTINNLDMIQAILRHPISNEIHVRRPSTPEVHQVKIIPLHLLEENEKGSGLIHRVMSSGRTTPHLKHNTLGSLSGQWTPKKKPSGNI